MTLLGDVGWEAMKMALLGGVGWDSQMMTLLGGVGWDTWMMALLRGVGWYSWIEAQNFNILGSLHSSAGWFGYNMFGNPEDRFSHVTDDIY